MGRVSGLSYPGLAQGSPALPGAPGSPALLALAALALLLAACGSEALELPDDGGAAAVAAPAPDAGAAAAPDAHAPQCQLLNDGDEFWTADTLVLNTKCDRVCRNTAGGLTCILRATLEITDCDACQ